jgi:hypothetical protein
MLPLRRTTPGLNGHRPAVGNLDGHDLGCLFGALNLVTGQLTTRLLEKPRTPTKPKKSRSGQRCLQEGFARHVREIARAYPAALYPRVVLVIDNAPWHRGALVTKALNECPYLSSIGCPAIAHRSKSSSASGGCCGDGPPTIGSFSREPGSSRRCATISATTRHASIGCSQ